MKYFLIHRYGVGLLGNNNIQRKKEQFCSFSGYLQKKFDDDVSSELCKVDNSASSNWFQKNNLVMFNPRYGRISK
ncbi:hypothetical protein M6B38_133315 [Iris pallida]|uniref:Uncharacterized protein n=1 Tax=Iris pallida TaxID=29817 RepID=A0AAX6FHN6_IRIPA|nr:hypothetical protein M6B38_133315 [Iris pallida]